MESGVPSLIWKLHPEYEKLFSDSFGIAQRNVDFNDSKRFSQAMTCMPGQGIFWQWDTCLMTNISKYAGDTLPVMGGIDNLYSMQRSDGYISMAYVTDEQQPYEAYGERINPPLYAWAEWSYYLTSGDDSRFTRILPILIRYFDWIERNRKRSCGLYWFEDSGSSGMDNSPRSGYFAKHLDGSDICHVDLACQQMLSADYIAKISAHLNQSDIETRMREEAAAIGERINTLHWNERTGFYYDLFARDETFGKMNYLNHKTAASFWTLLCGAADEMRAERMIGHLLNPEEFWTAFPASTLSKDDPNFCEDGAYWKGGVWAPTNYMIAKGLCRYGRRREARDLALRFLQQIGTVYEDPSYGSIYEAYSPTTAKPATNDAGALVRREFVGWSGLGTITMVLEFIFGIEPDAEHNAVHWTLFDNGTHGVQALSFCGQRIGLIFEADTDTVCVRAERSFTLHIRKPDEEEIVYSVASGDHRFSIANKAAD